jgi:uncharacterized protein
MTNRVFIPVSALGVRGKSGDRESATTLWEAEAQPRTELTELEQRLRMLLVDRVGGQTYVFDPESADITFVTPVIGDILQTLRAGKPVSEDRLQTVAEVLELEAPQSAVSAAGDWGLKLHLNHACNLACEYCYADGRTSDEGGHAKGAYGGPVTYMRRQVIEQAATIFMRTAPGERVSVIFFGGEPLLSEPRFLEAVDIVNDAAEEYGKTVQYSMTTNGTMLTDDILTCLKENSFRVAVSIDGRKETHDRQRPTARGTGSYDLAVAGLARLTNSGIPAAVRMTAFRGREGLAENHLSLATLPALATTFQFSFYGDDARRPMEKEESDALFEHYLDVARGVLRGEPGATKLGAVADVVAGIIFKRKRQFQCSAGRQFWAVAASGDVYPCHRFVGMGGYKIGNVMSHDFQFGSLKLFEENAVQNRVVKSDGSNNCRLCYAHNTCGGGCAQIAAANSGRIGELPPFYCQDTRLRVQAVVRSLAETLRRPEQVAP